jgi:hypothetical protein
MAIYFRCFCGQDLSAPESQAGGRKECPACGQRPPVPTLAEANQGLDMTSVPLLELPARSAPAGAPRPAACPALPGPLPTPKPEAADWFPEPDSPVYQVAQDIGIDEDRVRRRLERRQTRWLIARAREELDARERLARGWPMETFWFECLLYPLRAWPLLLGLAVAWATFTGLVVVLLPVLLPEDWEAADLGAQLPLWLFLFLVMGVLAGYTVAFMRCVLMSASEGEAGLIRWPGADVLLVLHSAAACLVGFLTGPVVAVVVAFLFWLNSGDLVEVDYLILGELGLVAAAGWVLALLAIDQGGRLRDVHPAALARHARKLGWRGWLAAGLMAVGLWAGAYVALFALEELHHSLLGWVVLVWVGFLGQAWTVFLLRWLGLSRYNQVSVGMRQGATAWK